MANSASASVIEYTPQGSRAERLLEYPFARPGYSYFTDGTEVLRAPEDTASFMDAADEYLAARGLALMADRTPVIAYGANASPFKLADKMGGKFTPDELRAELQVVPNIRAELVDTAIVWHGKPGQTGSTFAELYRSEDTKGVVSECFVQYLTDEQVALLHATEGVTYHFATVEANIGSDRQPLEALAYVAGSSQVLLEDEKPVLVKPLTKDATDNATTMTATQAVAYMLENASEVVAVTEPQTYIETAPLTLVEKKARQETVRAKLAELGLSKDFVFPEANRRGRADFNGPKGHTNASQPYDLQLMEQALGRFAEVPDNRLVSVVRRRAHDELAQHLSANTEE